MLNAFSAGLFAILERCDQKIGEFSVVQKRRTTDFEASKLWEGRSSKKTEFTLNQSVPEEPCHNFGALNLSHDVPDLHKIRRLTDIEALKLGKCLSGSISPRIKPDMNKDDTS